MWGDNWMISEDIYVKKHRLYELLLMELNKRRIFQLRVSKRDL